MAIRLFERQKLLLALTQSLGSEVTNTDFQKHLFLYTKLCEKESSYDFLPYRFGCYSFTANRDRHKLVESGYLKSYDDWQLKDKRRNYLSALPSATLDKIKLYAERFGAMRGNELIRHTYENYPYYATNSEIASKILSQESLSNIESHRPKENTKKVFATIGYEGRSIEAYIDILIRNGVRLLVDVRKNPISRKYGFSKSTLSKTLSEFAIKYEHMPKLGISSTDRKSLVSDLDYRELFDSYERETLNTNADSLDTLVNFLDEEKRIAITCFEESPSRCHRGRIAACIQPKIKNVEVPHY